MFATVASTVCLAHGARAEPTELGPPTPPGGGTEAAPAPAPAPYTASYGLRAPAAATYVRAETAYGLNAGASSTVVQYLSASYAPVDRLSIYARTGWVDYLPDKGPSGTAVTNVVLGAQWADKLSPELRWAATLGTGLPVGQGGGDTPDPGAAAAIAAGNLARSRLDGSTMFSPNDIAPFAGGDLAWVSGGFTLQAEVTLFELLRVRGSQVDPDSAKTSLDLGLHAGYFIVPELSVSLELRDQSFLSAPAAVDAGKISRSWVTAGGGVRAHFNLGEHVWLRPGLAYVQPLNDPSPTISASNFHIFQLDLPLSF